MEKGQRPRWAVRLIALASSVTVLAATSQATSIIIDVEADRIIIVADSRAEDTNSTSYTVRDDQCKIVVLGGHFAFEETGHEGYSKENAADLVPGFHGTTEAFQAYSSVPDHDLYKVALGWAARLTDDFKMFYLFHPQRVRELADPAGNLLYGLFAGSDSADGLKVYLARIVFDDTLIVREHVSIPVGYAVDAFPPKGAPARAVLFYPCHHPRIDRGENRQGKRSREVVDPTVTPGPQGRPCRSPTRIFD